MFDPPGTKFYDKASGRVMKLVTEGEWAGWLLRRHPDGHWVSLRKATDDDRARINAAVIAAHHDEED